MLWKSRVYSHTCTLRRVWRRKRGDLHGDLWTAWIGESTRASRWIGGLLGRLDSKGPYLVTKKILPYAVLGFKGPIWVFAFLLGLVSKSYPLIINPIKTHKNKLPSVALSAGRSLCRSCSPPLFLYVFLCSIFLICWARYSWDL